LVLRACVRPSSSFSSLLALPTTRSLTSSRPASHSFEKLRGTKEATVNSRQYRCVSLSRSSFSFSSTFSIRADPFARSFLIASEKAFVLSRGFVLHALQYPIASFAKEITHYYITLGKLEEVIDGVKKLIEISGAGGVREEEVWGDGDGVGRLTMGAILPLKVSLCFHFRLA